MNDSYLFSNLLESFQACKGITTPNVKRSVILMYVTLIEIDVRCTLEERGLAPRYQLQHL